MQCLYSTTSFGDVGRSQEVPDIRTAIESHRILRTDSDRINKHLLCVVQCGTLCYVRKKLTAIRLKPEQVEKLEKIALREDVPVSWLIRKAIDDFLKRHK